MDSEPQSTKRINKIARPSSVLGSKTRRRRENMNFSQKKHMDSLPHGLRNHIFSNAQTQATTPINHSFRLFLSNDL